MILAEAGVGSMGIFGLEWEPATGSWRRGALSLESLRGHSPVRATIRERAREPGHPGLVELREDYAALLRSTDRDDEAEALLAHNSENEL